MRDVGCLSESDLRAFLLGDLSERVGRSIATHLENCEDCEATAARLDGLTDPLINRLRREFHPTISSDRTLTAQPAEMPLPVLELPRRLAGYEIMDVIGRGGMSVVYRAQQTHPFRVVALKVLVGGSHADPERRARLLAEANAIARLRHPNVVQIHDVGEHEGIPFLVLEYVDGGTLNEHLGGAPLPPRRAAALAEQLARAVDFAHNAGVVHRDLKPTNILLSADGTPKVTDFGLAKQPDSDLTATGAILGTPQYMAPEQAEGKTRDVGPPADIYALGTILYEMLTGHPPFRAATALETLDQVRSREPIAPSQLVSRMTRDLDTICLTCLNKAPAARYASAKALADDLGRFSRGEPISARRSGSIAVTWRWCRRNPVVATLLGAVATLLVSLTLGASWTALRFQAIAATAKTEARTRLFESKVADARAHRLSGTVGQRFESLRLIGEAAQIARDEHWPSSQLDRLRNDAIATLTKFDIRDQRRIGTFARGVRAYSLSPDMTTEVWGLDKTTFTVRRIADGREIARVNCPSSGSTVAELMSSDARFLAIWSRTKLNTAVIRVWDLTRPGSGPTIDIEGDVEFLCWSFSTDGRRFAFGRSGGSVAIHDPSDGRELQVISMGRKPETLAFHPRRPWLAASVENSVEIHDVDHGGTAIRLAQAATAHQLAWHPKKDVLAVAVDDYKMHLWDAATGREVMVLEGFKDGGISGAFDHSGDLLVTMEWGGTTRFWDLRSGRQLLQTPESYGLTFSENDRLLSSHLVHDSSGDSLHSTEISDPGAFREFKRDTSHAESTFKGCAFSPRLPILAAAMSDGFGFWDLKTGHLLAKQTWPRGTASVAFEESGALLAHGATGITRWPLVQDQASPDVWRFGPPEDIAPPMVVDPEMFAASRDGSVIVRGEPPDPTVRHRGRWNHPIKLSPHDNARFVDVSPDGKWAATRSWISGSVKIWDAWTGRMEKQFPAGVTSFRFSPDSLWLATAGDRLRMWEVGTWKEKPLPMSDRVPVGNLTFSPDGKLLAAVTPDHTVRLMESQTGRELAQLEGPSRECLRSIHFSPDGTLLAGPADFQSIHVWDLRAVRRELGTIGLDWDLPAYAPASLIQHGSLRIEIDAGRIKGELPIEPAQKLKGASARSSDAAASNIENFQRSFAGYCSRP